MAIYKGNTKLDANGLQVQVSSVPTGSIMQYDGNTIPAGYEEVANYYNNLTLKKYVITRTDGTKASGSWQDFTGVYTTDTIPVGTYLVVVRFLAGGQNTSGVLTAKLLIDGAEEEPSWRSTIPLPNTTAYVSGMLIEPKIFTSETTHTLQLQGYGTANWVAGAGTPRKYCGNVHQIDK